MLLAVCALPPLAIGADQSCAWLRDAAAPGNGVVYTLCEQGGLWATVDGGATWNKRDTAAPERARAMAFLDANRGFVIGDRGMLLSTADGGKKWQPVPIESFSPTPHGYHLRRPVRLDRGLSGIDPALYGRRTHLGAPEDGNHPDSRDSLFS